MTIGRDEKELQDILARANDAAAATLAGMTLRDLVAAPADKEKAAVGP